MQSPSASMHQTFAPSSTQTQIAYLQCCPICRVPADKNWHDDQRCAIFKKKREIYDKLAGIDEVLVDHPPPHLPPAPAGGASPRYCTGPTGCGERTKNHDKIRCGQLSLRKQLNNDLVKLREELSQFPRVNYEGHYFLRVEIPIHHGHWHAPAPSTVETTTTTRRAAAAHGMPGFTTFEDDNSNSVSSQDETNFANRSTRTRTRSSNSSASSFRSLAASSKVKLTRSKNSGHGRLMIQVDIRILFALALVLGPLLWQLGRQLLRSASLFCFLAYIGSQKVAGRANHQAEPARPHTPRRIRRRAAHLRLQARRAMMDLTSWVPKARCPAPSSALLSSYSFSWVVVAGSAELEVTTRVHVHRFLLYSLPRVRKRLHLHASPNHRSVPAYVPPPPQSYNYAEPTPAAPPMSYAEQMAKNAQYAPPLQPPPPQAQYATPSGYAPPGPPPQASPMPTPQQYDYPATPATSHAPLLSSNNSYAASVSPQQHPAHAQQYFQADGKSVLSWAPAHDGGPYASASGAPADGPPNYRQ
uniref:Hap4 transcription factor heteromerisation domain-containing protein n=1 Tax=Mycena chlorophos TaxID=658473 RepID=A0ABQ0KYA4_MYCCL|nr:predicted protein [Mycena chlorophos]